MSIPYFLIINKPNCNTIEIIVKTDVGNNIDEIKINIIKELEKEFSKLDMPDNYEEFMFMSWYDTLPLNVEVFEYKIFMDGKWVKPWTNEELYEYIYEILYKIRELNAYINE